MSSFLTRIVDLEYGENTFYILEYCGDYNELYTLKIYRHITIGTQYFKAENDETNYYDTIVSNLTNAVSVKKFL